MFVGKNTYIGNVNGVMNAVITQGKPVGESIFQGEILELSYLVYVKMINNRLFETVHPCLVLVKTHT